jgi:hypothetical protein
MKRKTIEKVIKLKMLKWIDTLPEELRKPVKDNILVSGGCITSMFLKEPINDFDVYIQDIDVLYDLANYYLPNRVFHGKNKEEYVKEYLEEKSYKGDFKDYLNEDQFKIFGEIGDVSQNFLRIKNLKIDQIKMLVPYEGFKLERDDKKEVQENSFIPVFISENAISLSDHLQIVTRFSGGPKKIHSTFDYIHATNYFTFDKGLVTNVKALECILTKELKYQGSLYPLTSIIRMKKFIARGWTMNAGEVLKMMFQVSELDLKNPDVLEEQLIGVDVAYFAALIAILRGADKTTIGYPYLKDLIDKVFNNHEDED